MNSRPMRGQERHRPGKHRDRRAQGQDAVTQRPAQQRAIDPGERPQHGIGSFPMHPPPQQERAEHRHQRHRQQRGAQHGEGLGKGERMEQLALLVGEGKNREKGQQDNRHGEKDRPPDQVRRVAARVAITARAVAGVHPALFEEAEGVLCHHDGGVHQDADGDGNAGQRHDVGADAGVAHPKKRRQHRQGQRQRDDQDRAQMQQKNDVHQCDDDDLLDQRLLEGLHRPADELRAVVEGHDPHAGRQPGRDRLNLALTRSMTSIVLTP